MHSREPHASLSVLFGIKTPPLLKTPPLVFRHFETRGGVFILSHPGYPGSGIFLTAPKAREKNEVLARPIMIFVMSLWYQNRTIDGKISFFRAPSARIRIHGCWYTTPIPETNQYCCAIIISIFVCCLLLLAFACQH